MRKINVEIDEKANTLINYDEESQTITLQPGKYDVSGKTIEIKEPTVYKLSELQEMVKENES